MNAIRFTLAGGALVLLAACAPGGGTLPPESLGESVRHNMAVHILPVPPAASAAPSEVPGRRGDVAMERYMTGRVRQPGAPGASGSGAGAAPGLGGMPGQ